MNEEKMWYQSKAIWGSLIAVFAGLIATITGHVITANDQTFLSTEAVNAANAIASIVTIIGGVIAWYGRYTAKKTISPKALKGKE